MLVFFFGSFTEVYATEETSMMTVRLRNFLGNKDEVSMKVRGEYTLLEDKNIALDPDQQYYIRVHNGGLQLLDNTRAIKNFSSSITLQPKTYDEQHYIFLEDRGYLGEMQLTVEDGKYVRPINRVLLEDYLKSVVPREMPASWGSPTTGGMEALKAQAVTARSYAYRRLNRIIDDTQLFQVYGGYKTLNVQGLEADVWHPNSTKAVNDTKGEVVLVGAVIADTVYSSSNGGIIESNFGAWGTPELSYLKAKVDEFDPKHSWNFRIRKQQIDPREFNPHSWWDSAMEEQASLANRLKEQIKLLDSYKTADSFKIERINDITFSEKTDGQRYKQATFNISFYVRASRQKS